MRRIVIRVLTVALTVYGAMFFCKAKENGHAGHNHSTFKSDHADHNHGEHSEAKDAAADDDHDHAVHRHADVPGIVHDEDNHSEDEMHEKSAIHEHEEHEHESHEGHDHHAHDDGEQGVTLDPDARKIAGIRIDTLEKRRFKRSIELPGRIGFNEDRLMHVTPRFGGVVKEVKCTVGSFVKKDQVLAVMENNATLSTYQVKAPFSGTIIEKHATLGESVGDGRELFILADLSNVWVNCDVYASDIDILKKGLPAVVTTIDEKVRAEAAVSYIAPVFNEGSSTGYLRIVLSNAKGKWRPGMFIRAVIIIDDGKPVPVVNNDAIQIVDEEKVVFVPGSGNSFVTRPIVTGRRTAELTEITAGLADGEPYVADGAFELKATMITSGMDPHAGHGH